MKKILLCLLVFSLISLNAADTWKTNTVDIDPWGKFSIDLPEKYMFVKGGSEEYITNRNRTGEPGEIYEAWNYQNSFYTEDYINNYDNKSRRKWFKKVMTQNNDEFSWKNYKINKRKYNGIRYLEIIKVCKHQVGKSKFTIPHEVTIVFAKDGVAHMFTLNSDNPYNSELLNEFGKILATFKFTKPETKN
ncbi:hypothetical protein ACFL56_01465 [Candidatus Margulisiibacteriota bacterium]